jgi:hypothetical protein
MKSVLQKIAKHIIIAAHDGLKYHVTNNIPLANNIYRCGSKEYFNLYKYARLAGITVSQEDSWFIKSDLGKFASYEDTEVPLDYPFEVTAAEYKGKDIELNTPKRGGSKKFYVYVKDGDKVIKVSFGQPGMAVRNNNEVARKSFLARHRCHECKLGSTKCPKTSARYWSCNIHRYAKQLGLKSTKPW